MTTVDRSLEWLFAQLQEQYPGKEEMIWAGMKAKRVTSLRVNTLKSDADEVCKALNEAGMQPERCSFYPDAYLLPSGSEVRIRQLEPYETGKIYLQSLSAMIPALVMDIRPNEDVLDMCAAPGGKTSHLVQLTGNRAMVTACEPDRIRCDRMRSNLKKLGCERVNILNMDARKLDDFLKFDRILLDAPCSGSGTLYLGEDEGKKPFSEKLVTNSARLQTQLIRKACALLKPGGRLVYSTCSILRQENEQQAREILKDRKMRLVPVSADHFPGTRCLDNSLSGTLTVMPDEHFEGFYISVFEKHG